MTKETFQKNPLQGKEEILKKIKELTDNKDQNSSKLEEMAKNIQTLREEISADKEKNRIENSKNNETESKTYSVDFIKQKIGEGEDFDAEKYEREMLEKDDVRTREMEDLVDGMQLEEEKQNDGSKNYSEYLKNKNKEKKKVAKEQADKLINSILEHDIKNKNNNPKEKTDLEKAEELSNKIKEDLEEKEGGNLEEEKNESGTKKLEGEENKNEEETKVEEEKTLEERLGEAREKYIIEFKKNKKKPTEEFIKSKKEYDQIRKEMGEGMFAIKKAELEKAGLSGEELEKALINYKATEILAKTILEERQKIVDARAEGSPIKPALWKKLITSYTSIKPRWKRVALSTLIFLPLAATAGAGGAAVAAYGGVGLVGLATVKFATSMAIGTVSAYSTKGIDLLLKKKDHRVERENKNYLESYKKAYSKNQITMEQYEELVSKNEEEERRRIRNRNLLKASVGIAIGFGAGFAAYNVLDNVLDSGVNNIESTTNSLDSDNIINKPEITDTEIIKIPQENTFEHLEPKEARVGVELDTKTLDAMRPKNIIDHSNIVEAEANNGQGAISTIYELKRNIRAEYPEGTDMPDNVKHILETDAHDLAREYGMYRPGEEAESAKVFAGDKIIFDKETGEVSFHQAKTGEDIILQKGVEYKGDMFDAGKSKIIPESQNESYSVPEQTDPTDPFANPEPLPNTGEIGSGLLEDNSQVSHGEDLNTGNEVFNNKNEGVINNQDTKTSSDFNNEEAIGGTQREIKIDGFEKVPTYEESVNHFFPDNESTHEWDRISKYNAQEVMQEINKNGDENLKPFFQHIKNLHDQTGLEPKGVGIFRTYEKLDHYLGRLIKESVKIEGGK